MKKLSTAILANLIITNRKKLSMTQQSLADATGINRSLISRMEKEDFLPSIPQLEQLGEVLGFDLTDVFTNVLHDEQDSEFVMDLTEPAEYSCAMGSSSIIRFSSWDYTKTIV
jgi:DNA-binding XRE family transcriptional regulator